jgi:dTMP kinase
MYNNLFFTFEGGECAGKTTLINSLFATLNEKGISAIKTREPGGTHLGVKIRSILLDPIEEISSATELLLFAADRSHHTENVIRPALQRGDIVLCDRYIDSSFAYQGQHFKHEVLKSIMEFATGGLLPKFTFYLDLDPKIGFERAEKRKQQLDRIEKKGLEFHERTRRAFLELAKRYKERIVVIDAARDPEAVLEEVLGKIYETI